MIRHDELCSDTCDGYVRDAMFSETMPCHCRCHRVVRLTIRERYALIEAVRLAQEISEEGTGRLDPVLSRVQRKLGTTVGSS